MYGVDVGYGFTKGAALTGRRCCFPSAVAARRGTGDLAAVVGAQALRHRVTVERLPAEAAPEEWLAGEAALQAGAVRTWETEASRREGYDVLLLTALALLGAEGTVTVAVGLPLGVWLRREERLALRDRLAGLSARVVVDGGPARSILVGRVRVLPQGLGAYMAALNAGAAHLAGQPVGLVDVGYRTTDYVLLEPGPDGVAIPDDSRSGSVDAGAGQVVQAVRQAVAAETGTLPPEGLVEAALRNGGRLTVRGRDFDLRPAHEAALKDLAARVQAQVQRAWADRLDFLAAVLVAGGGGETLAPHLGLPVLRVVPDAVHANATGFALLAAQG